MQLPKSYTWLAAERERDEARAALAATPSPADVPAMISRPQCAAELLARGMVAAKEALAMATTRDVQKRLKQLGFDPGPIDGAPGPRTRAAVVAYQRAHGLDPDGVVGPLTIASLFLATMDRPPLLGASTLPEMAPWLAEMTRRMGLHESRDNGALSAWLRSAGKYLGNPARNPWCGDAVESCFALTLPNEPLPANPFWAQAWADFGQPVGAIPGAVGVIRWSAKAGHVGFVIRATSTHVTLRGGNQSNMIKDVAFPRSKFIAFRWPLTFPITSYPPIVGEASRIASAGATR